MDPAELDPIKSALQNQGAAIGRHEQLLHDMMQQLTLLVRAQAEGAQPASTGTGAAAGASAAAPALASPLPPTDPTPIRGESSVANPDRYAGDPETCRGFLLQCSLVFEQQPSRFPTERSKVAYMTSLLTGRALAWATSLWERASPDTASGESFMRAMRTTFHNPRGGREAAPRLLALSQGTCSVADYAIEFRTLAAESGWNEEALMAVFQQGLNGRLKDELATRELPSTLEEYWDLQRVFSKEEARVLPPHREFDCAINLLPGTTPPRGRLFALSSPERAAMEDYIREALEQGQWAPPGPEPSPEPIIPAPRILAPLRWSLETAIREAQQREPDPGDGPAGKLYVPASVRQQALRWGHASPFTGHPGVARTLDFLRRRFWWPSMERDVRAFIVSCETCARCKAPRSRPQGLLHPLPIPARPWSHVSLDFITGLPPSRGNTAILVLVDRFSKACKFVALPKLPSAKETAELLLQHVVRVHGMPSDLVSDRGPQFASRFWKAFCQLMGASVSLSSGFHPESNSQTERVNQDLARTLRCLTSANPSSWAEHLPWAEYAHNTLRHSSLGMSPFECQFGFPPPMFPEEEREVGVPAAEQFVLRCRRAWQKARASLLTTTEARKQVADRRRRPAPTFRPGQRVWLSAKDLPLHVESKKLAPRYVGPFKVDRRVNPVSYRLRLPPSMRVHPTFHVSRLRPFLCGTRPPAPRFVAGSPAYTVRRLLDSRRVRGRVQYLVDWEGYGPEERSWVPASHILDPDLIREFRRARAAPFV
ncbi:hypothetical protein MHYP_G00240320 [Metynnis hypsauchen]